jgi:hypothetical protein
MLILLFNDKVGELVYMCQMLRLSFSPNIPMDREQVKNSER